MIRLLVKIPLSETLAGLLSDDFGSDEMAMQEMDHAGRGMRQDEQWRAACEIFHKISLSKRVCCAWFLPACPPSLSVSHET